MRVVKFTVLGLVLAGLAYSFLSRGSNDFYVWKELGIDTRGLRLTVYEKEFTMDFDIYYIEADVVDMKAFAPGLQVLTGGWRYKDIKPAHFPVLSHMKHSPRLLRASDYLSSKFKTEIVTKLPTPTPGTEDGPYRDSYRTDYHCTYLLDKSSKPPKLYFHVKVSNRIYPF
jgi:hypothetical protein